MPHVCTLSVGCTAVRPTITQDKPALPFSPILKYSSTTQSPSDTAAQWAPQILPLTHSTALAHKLQPWRTFYSPAAVLANILQPCYGPGGQFAALVDNAQP